MAAQGGAAPVEESTPVTISGFAVGLGSYDRNLARNTATASKLAVSMFRPWSDQLYLFAQLTTHVAQHDTSEVHTHIEIDNLIPGHTYFYVRQSVDHAGNVQYSFGNSFTTQQ